MSDFFEGIDVVIAWVDGEDPVLKDKRLQYQDVGQATDAIKETRFASNYEIYYNIASILKFVPFCRKIYVITDSQKPIWIDHFSLEGICEPDKIKIIDHREIFSGYGEYLPTFNTRTIETMIWNIEGLSDFFIYLNDDFFFNSSAQIEDFINQDKIVIYGHWKSCLGYKIKLKIRKILNKFFHKPIQPSHVIAQMLGADILGFDHFFEIHHNPHSVDRQILRKYLLEHPDVLRTQIKYKFRSVEQLNPISLMNHLKILKDEAVLKSDLDIAYLKDESSLASFLNRIQDERIQYGCMQSLDQLGELATKQIYAALNAKFHSYLPQVMLAQTKSES